MAVGIYCAAIVDKGRTSVFVLRSRDEEELSKCDTIFDVGGKYDPDYELFDHHQLSFQNRFVDLAPQYFPNAANASGFADPETTTPMAAAGLALLHFGEQFLLHQWPPTGTLPAPSPAPAATGGGGAGDGAVPLKAPSSWLYDIYGSIVEGVDALDNGFKICVAPAKPNYYLPNHLSAQVGSLNLPWYREEETDATADTGGGGGGGGGGSEKLPSALTQNQRFMCAVATAVKPLFDFLWDRWQTLSRSWPLVAPAVKEAVDQGRRYVVLPGFSKWTRVLHMMEERMGLEENQKMLFCVFGDGRKGGGMRMQTIPIDIEDRSLGSRARLPFQWAGKGKHELDTATGPTVTAGAVFCHKGRWICGHKTEQGIREMAELAIKIHGEEGEKARRAEHEGGQLAMGPMAAVHDAICELRQCAERTAVVMESTIAESGTKKRMKTEKK